MNAKSNVGPFIGGAVLTALAFGLMHALLADQITPSPHPLPGDSAATPASSDTPAELAIDATPRIESEAKLNTEGATGAAEVIAAKETLAKLSARVEQLEADNSELGAEKSALEQQIEELRGAAPRHSTETFRFGLPEQSPNFDSADWGELGGTMSSMAGLMPEVAKQVAANGRLDPKLQAEVGKLNLGLASFAIKAHKELGRSPNGAFTHPAVIANLIRTRLEAAEDPLSGSQEATIEALGSAWSRSWEQTQSGFTETTIELAKTAAEVESKQRFMDNVRGALSESQDTLLFPAETTGRQGIDLLSPALVYVQRAQQRNVDETKLASQALTALLSLAGIEKDLVDYSWIGEDWVRASPTATQALPALATDRVFPHVNDLQAAAKAQLDAIDRIIAVGGLEAEQEASLRKIDTLIEIHWVASSKSE